MAYELVWEPEGVLKRFSGQVSAREFVESAGRVQGDSRFDETHYIINDFSDIAGHELTETALTDVAALQYGAHASNPNCRIVFVTAEQALADLVLRVMTAPALQSYEIAVHPTLTAARDWLESQPQLHLLSDVMGFRLRQ